MSPDKILVTTIGGATIYFIVWFFFLASRKQIKAAGSVDIIVEGGYTPQNIVVKKGIPTVLNFLRHDQNTCLEEVVLSSFGIKKFLPLNKTVSVEINPQEKGEYPFSCGMNMYHGKIIVE